MRNDKDRFESDFQDLLHEQEELADRYASSCSTIKALESTLQDTKIREEARLRALVEACIKSSGKLASRAMAENDVVAGATGTSAYFMMIAEELQVVLNELAIVYDQYLSDNTNVEGFARKVVLGGHLMATVHVQGMLICNTSSDIECGERMVLYSEIVFFFGNHSFSFRHFRGDQKVEHKCNGPIWSASKQ